MARKIEALVNPAVLSWARESAGFAQETAAGRLRISADRLVSWEKGEYRPTVPQLRKLAQLYRRPLAVFYFSEPPPAEKGLHDFRRMHGRPVRQASPELLLAIRRARDRREIALDLYHDLESAPSRFELTASPTAEPEETGALIRSHLKISAVEPRTWQTPYDALNRWRSALEESGILVFQATDVDLDDARGFSITDRPLPAVAVNIKDAVYGRIFTMMHELAHVVVNNGGICDVDETTEEQHEALEVFCNHVAGATLVPRDQLLEAPMVAGTSRPKEWQDDVLRQLSRMFHVSRETVLRRLLLLGLTTAAHYRDKRRQFVRESAELAALRPEGFAPHHRVQLSSAGPLFTQLVVEAFNRERITASEVADFLAIRIKHLPEIERDLMISSE